MGDLNPCWNTEADLLPSFSFHELSISTQLHCPICMQIDTGYPTVWAAQQLLHVHSKLGTNDIGPYSHQYFFQYHFCLVWSQLSIKVHLPSSVKGKGPFAQYFVSCPHSCIDPGIQTSLQQGATAWHSQSCPFSNLQVGKVQETHTGLWGWKGNSALGFPPADLTPKDNNFPPGLNFPNHC